MAETNQVRLPYEYYPDPTRGRPVFNGQIFVGNPDTDPEVEGNRKQVTAIQEDGGSVNIAQPIRTGSGGVPLLNGSPVQLTVEGEYSIKVLDANGQQVYYAESLVGGQNPVFVTRTQVVPTSVNLSNRLINSTLFATNQSWQDYYNRQSPVPNREIDFGANESTSIGIENIPVNRFDWAEGNSTTDFGAS